MGGYTMVFEYAGDLTANRETSLRFTVNAATGQSVTLQPYMGMLGHAVVRRSGGEVFTHLHPLGTVSMAAQEVFARRERATDASANGPATASASAFSTAPAIGNLSSSVGNQVSFPYAFPRSGDYRMWVQVRVGGRVLTGVFDVLVKPGGV